MLTVYLNRKESENYIAFLTAISQVIIDYVFKISLGVVRGRLEYSKYAGTFSKTS